jgi:hypothetical protein
VLGMMANIACNFGFKGSDLLDYTNLNVEYQIH